MWRTLSRRFFAAEKAAAHIQGLLGEETIQEFIALLGKADPRDFKAILSGGPAEDAAAYVRAHLDERQIRKFLALLGKADVGEFKAILSGGGSRHRAEDILSRALGGSFGEDYPNEHG